MIFVRTLKIQIGALVLFAVLNGHSALATEMPRFFAETETAGIDHAYSGGFKYMVGGGVAAFDCDGNNLPDLYFAGGDKPARLYINQSLAGGALKFEASDNSDLKIDSVIGVYPLDIDGDGITDLAILRHGQNILMKGQGKCRFQQANDEWNFDGGDSWTTSFSATWEKGASWPTLAFGNFMIPETVVMDYGDCAEHTLHRPTADGGYGVPTSIKPGHCALSMLFSDWNRDDVPDLRISNDKEFHRGGEEQLFKLATKKTPVGFTREDGWQKVSIWGMGIASHDLTGDGYPDYYLTNMIDNRFEVLADTAEKPIFEDHAKTFGIEAGYPFTGGDKKPSTAWHAEFGDVNNDGLADLLIVKGNVDVVKFVADVDPNNLLIQQEDGMFREGAKEGGILSFELGRSGSLIDLNMDGALDLVVTNRNAVVEVWRNKGVSGNWLRIKPQVSGGNRQCVGCWIEVKAADRIQRRELTVGGGHAGGQWGWVHFGIGDATEASVRLKQLGKEWTPWVPVDANQFLSLVRTTDGRIAHKIEPPSGNDL